MLNVYYIVPEWFIGYDILLKIIFGIITLLVGIYAFKIYKLSEQRQSKIFSAAFILISISYFFHLLLNLIIIAKLTISKVMTVRTFNLLVALGIYSHIIFFLAGLVTLFYMTINVKSKRLYSLLLLISLLPLLFTENKLTLFNFMSGIMLVYVVIHYIINYINKKQIRNLSIMLAFVFLLLGSFDFIFSLNRGLYYILGDLLVLVAYSIILINLIQVAKK